MIAIVAFMAPTASQVVQNVQAHYAKLPQLSAHFDQKVTNALSGKPIASHGTLAFAKPGKFRVSYAKVVKQQPKQDKDFVSDGTTFWMVDYGNLEIRIASAGSNASFDAIGAFLTNGNLAATYTIALSGNTLQLTPKQATAGVAHVDFVVDPATWNVTESIVTAPSGDTSDFTFSAISSGLLPPGTFTVNPKAMPTFKVITMAPVAPSPATAPAPKHSTP